MAHIHEYITDTLTEAQVEARVEALGLNAPRVTATHIDAVIVKQDYYVFPDTTLTVCMLTLVNGYHVTGESAAASPANFDAELGRQVAYRNARNKVWGLEGYLLRDRLHRLQSGALLNSQVG